jgi:hypothetical protein
MKNAVSQVRGWTAHPRVAAFVSTLRRRKPDDASGDELAARSSSAPLAGGQCDPSNTLEMRQALLPEDGRHLDE